MVAEAVAEVLATWEGLPVYKSFHSHTFLYLNLKFGKVRGNDYWAHCKDDF